MNNHPFYEMFDCCHSESWLRDMLNGALVTEATIDRGRLHMDISILFPTPPPPIGISSIEGELSREYGLSSVSVHPLIKGPPAGNGNGSGKPLPKKTGKSKPKPKNKVILGRALNGKPTPMSEVSLESGRVHIAGEVFQTEHKFLDKRRSWVMRFCITDNTNSLRVSKFFVDESEGKALCTQIKDGMYLHLRGDVSFNRYDQDLSLEPTDINIGQKEERVDPAEEKRVELHLHTRFSALDALTDPGKAIAQAAAWGHPAIAITDHGVAQAFPEAYWAGKKHNVKIIYGLEGYYINDCDDRLAVSAPCDWDLDGEFVAFDLETTGINPKREAITEIGAVLMKGEKQIDSFQSFVNPGRPIPPNITRLTGIRDEDVANAPSPAEALRQFLDFVGDRPLVAHNAGFDMGFLQAGCNHAGLALPNAAIDTLTLSQTLLPDLKRHKLDVVANHLGLPAFNHHRASDDAKTVAHMMAHFLSQLKAEGLKNVNELNNYILKSGSGALLQGGRHVKHIVLLAKNQAGLKNLYKLISLSHLNHFHRYPRIPKSLLQENREGLLIGSACEAGELFSAILDGKNQADLERLASFYDYLEIQPLCNNLFLLESGKVQNIEQLRECNREILRLGEKLNIPVIAAGDVHFLHPEEEEYRQILLASKKFADADKPLPLYFKTTQEMLEEFSYLGEEKAYEVVIENPKKIAESCESLRPLPKGRFFPKMEAAADELKDLVYGKVRDLYGENPPEIVKARVEKELGDIISCQYDVIYMSAQKLVAKSLEAGYLVGSRGSVGSSLVAFLSGITEVNALAAHYRCPSCKHADFDAGEAYGCGADMPDAPCPKCGVPYEKEGFDIPFETFLGFDGDKVPDIDLNFSGEYQSRAHKETNALFGADHVFRAGTIGTIKSKTAYGFVKKYLEERKRTPAAEQDLPDEEDLSDDEPRQVPASDEKPRQVPTRAEENRLTQGLVGVKRTTGQHPGGLVVIPQDMEIYDFCPVQHPADDKESGIITTHFEYKAMEDNLIKLDLLGHDDPTMIKYLEDASGIDPRKIPLDDPDTRSIFHSPLALGLPENDPIIGKTGTIAVPEFGTPFTREMLADTLPEKFDTLVRLSGFSHGTDVWLGNAKDLILSGTASVSEAIGCRDDIMLFLIQKGMDERTAFAVMESVRKGYGLKPEWAVEMEQLDVPQWYIDSCRKIKYLFPKAHAVAYVMMAFRIAWYKVHKPLVFYKAYFTVRAKAFDAYYMCRGQDVLRAKIEEIMRNPEPSGVEEDMLVTLEVCYEMYLRGFSFAPLDLYKSAATQFIMLDDKRLLPPFIAVAGLGETAAIDLVKQREGREFVSVEDLLAACPKVSSAHITELKKLGTLDNLPDTSQMTLF